MYFKAATSMLMMSLALTPTMINCEPVRALVYRGPTACDGCPESLRDLLVATIPNIKVEFAGPKEKVKINAKSLKGVNILAQPGGPDLDAAWREARPYASDVRTWVANGGRYLGVCLGAFLAGHDSGFGLIPKGDRIQQEITRPNPPIDDGSDIVTQIDWTFQTGRKKGKTERHWAYFQDGTTFIRSSNSPAKVLGKYVSNGDVASVLNSYGKGWVANIGVHPEADQSWYDDAGITNPEGVQTEIGHDIVNALMAAGSVRKATAY
ncbi:uncharacterized protein RCC_08068 [Ramularia collo-cygni]|uniref:Biotin-protein ligase N-terminal domain-containing protein n=1 Tax=Ramularia collo-cygni TaxID=112498 RepID=A0A2D3VJD9_9PEZI|nr:uncharacterized protein RCC_08068 [Ramularia collo-cygni]CZT22199.1 uncharacterized protein RCC_08068 [Ramularia collo-cygni]